MRQFKWIKILFCASVFSFLSLFIFADESLKYVSCYGFATSCDVTFTDTTDPRQYIHPENLNPGDVIWIQSYYVPIFSREILPRINTPFVLVIHWGDESFPTSHEKEVDIENFIANKNILHIFAQNCDYTGPQIDKVSPLPIGLDLHTLARGGGAFSEVKDTPQGQEQVLDQVAMRLLPTNQRLKKGLIDFHQHDTIAAGWSSINRYLDVGETRKTIAEKIAPFGVVDFMNERIKRREYWKKKGEYTFSISPPGNGLDTHRTWEDLILGCIVIVKSSPMDRLYEGLPVVIIQDWSEINEENFEFWSAIYGDVSKNPEYRKRLTLEYWMGKIQSYSNLVF